MSEQLTKLLFDCRDLLLDRVIEVNQLLFSNADLKEKAERYCSDPSTSEARLFHQSIWNHDLPPVSVPPTMLVER